MSLRLGIRRDPHWVEVGHGVGLLLRPAQTALVTAAQLRAQKHLVELTTQREAAQVAGLPWDGPDFDDAERRMAYLWAYGLLCLARELVIDWRGVCDADGEPLPFSAAGLPELLSHYDIADAFSRSSTAPIAALAAEGNG